MNIDLEVQKALRARLVNTASLVEIVPAGHILDTNQWPAPVPSIVLGQSQIIDEGSSLQRTHWRVYHTLHVWTRSASHAPAKEICDQIRRAVGVERLALPSPLHCTDLRVISVQMLRDPDGEHSHGVVTVDALISEGRA